jgi:hypothetical protein
LFLFKFIFFCYIFHEKKNTAGWVSSDPGSEIPELGPPELHQVGPITA